MHVNCNLRNESESDLRSNEHYLSGNENKAWKKSRQVIVALCLVIGCRNQTLLFIALLINVFE